MRERRKLRAGEQRKKPLSPEQTRAMKELENFGWEVVWVRQPLFQEARVGMRDPRTGRRAVVHADGRVDHLPDEPTRRVDDPL
ncbi:MAG: hypothetical protein KatS3mg124_1493 [Porticoccaceae bacterium]|nr:MAG: hypothetical protein KatS3mg124_1493 [Porticoccaceae bacterium]